jgi:hypothetical protein
MAMSFTIASGAREILGTVISERWRKQSEEEDRKAAAYEEVSFSFLTLKVLDDQRDYILGRN